MHFDHTQHGTEGQHSKSVDSQKEVDWATEGARWREAAEGRGEKKEKDVTAAWETDDG